MPTRFEMEMGRLPEDGADTIVARWTFYCGSCKTKRTAVIFGSGHIFDLVDGQEPVVENVVVVNNTFKNLYFVPEAGVEGIRATREGMEAIKSSIGYAHADQFHGGGRVSLKGKN